MKIRNFLRDPLIHFLGIGLVIFVLSTWIGSPEKDEPRVINLGPGDVAAMVEVWEKTRFRQPTETELQGLIESRIREEILYREALALGLEEGDTVVRRRLAQKVAFMSEGLMDPSEPSEADLRVWLEANPETFEDPARISLDQVYLNPKVRGQALEQDARTLLAALRDGKVTADDGIGDPIMLVKSLAGLTKTEIAGIFGSHFAEAVMRLAPGQWLGPVQSGYGAHLVYVRHRREASLPELTSVRDRVRETLLSERRREAAETYFRFLREKYEIKIEYPEISKPRQRARMDGIR